MSGLESSRGESLSPSPHLLLTLRVINFSIYYLYNPKNDFNIDFLGGSICTDIFHSLPQSTQETTLSLVRSFVLKDIIFDSHEGHCAFIILLFNCDFIMVSTHIPPILCIC